MASGREMVTEVPSESLANYVLLIDIRDQQHSCSLAVSVDYMVNNLVQESIYPSTLEAMPQVSNLNTQDKSSV